MTSKTYQVRRMTIYLTMKTMPKSPPSCNRIAKNDNEICVMLFLRVFFKSLFTVGSSVVASLSMQALHICQNTGTIKRAFISTIVMSASEITLRTPMTYKLKPADSTNEPIKP